MDSIKDNTYYQKKFFDQLKHRYSQDITVVNEVMEVLNLKKGAAYKRMNGDTAMSIAELMKLAEHFDLSLDSVFHSEKYASFFHPFVHKEESSLGIFISQYKKIFKPMKDLNDNDNIELTYLANELPLFYYFGHKYIFNFVISIWQHLHWDDVSLNIGAVDEYEAEAREIRKEIVENYFTNSVTEIWNSNMLNNLYQQIIFCITIRAFQNSEYIHLLINDIENLILHLRDISISGVKSFKGASVEGSQLKIYLNDFGNYLNIVQFDSKRIIATFLGYDYPQFIFSHNRPFFDFTKDWINRIKKRSVVISSDGYQYRELFFIKMENDLKYFKERVKKLMEVYY